MLTRNIREKGKGEKKETTEYDGETEVEKYSRKAQLFNKEE